MERSQCKNRSCMSTGCSSPKDHSIHCSKGCIGHKDFPKHHSHFASYCSNTDRTYHQGRCTRSCCHSHCQTLGCSSCSSHFRPNCSYHIRNQSGFDCTTVVGCRSDPSNCFAQTVWPRWDRNNHRRASPPRAPLGAQLPQKLPRCGREYRTHHRGPAWFPACSHMLRTRIALEKEMCWFSSWIGLRMLVGTLDRCLQLYPCLRIVHQS